jgi:UDP-3-O-[3-hydroxymyristoyl] N-acetylglucosamine deacetylase/3-hydroxyacyl-[acyl-carrier-protein] dehydratase
LKRKQTTLADSAELAGTGLHTGVESRATLRPAEAGDGIVFALADGEGTREVRVGPETTGAYMHRTVAEADGLRIHTIEHVMAALAGTGVDNARIELTAPEPPGGDGSAAIYAELIERAGIRELDAVTEPLVLDEPLTVSDGRGGVIAAVPHDKGLKLSYAVHYAESRLARGLAEYEIDPAAFRNEIAGARTFCMEAHVDAMREAGCGHGADCGNTLVLREESVVDNELRFEDEPARHKVLDLLGDLAVVGRPLQMHVVACKSGHPLNAAFVDALTERMRRKAHPRGLMDINDIEATLPHRYPFLLVDRILELDPGRRVVGLKNVTRNEEFFEGHFPGQPVMPGVLQIEALAQTGGVMMLRMSDADAPRQLAVLMSVDGVKYRRPVVPGDQLLMTVEMEKVKGRVGQVIARAEVDGTVATQARIKFALVDAESYT